MRLRRLSLALTGAAAMAVILVGVGLPGVPTSSSTPVANTPSPLWVWAEANYQGDFLGGLNASVVISVPTLPAGDASVYVDGSFSALSWIYLTHGLFNASGVCANSFPPAGACGIYVGIWTSAAWEQYLRGQPLAPVWCFPGNTAVCTNSSSGDLGTPNLAPLDGTAWVIVLWNLAPYELSGEYQFTVYSSTPSS